MHIMATSAAELTLKGILFVTTPGLANVVLTLFHAEQRGDLSLTLADIQSAKFTFGSIEMCPEE